MKQSPDQYNKNNRTNNNAPQKQKTFLENVVEILVIGVVIFLIRTFIFGLYIVPTGSMEPTMLVGARFFADKFSYYVRKPNHREIIAFNDPEFEYSKNYFYALFQQHVWGPANWTKRVIAVPGDEVRGVIEDGKPVIYLNGVKLDEPYINPYPLIHIWTRDLETIQKEVTSEIEKLSRHFSINKTAASEFMMRKIGQYTTWRTYDPTFSFEDQPFYKIHEGRLVRDKENNPELIYPQTPLYRSDARKEKKRGIDEYWNGSDEFFVKLKDGEYWCMGDNRRGSKDCRVFGPVAEKYIHGKIVFQIFSIDNDDTWTSWMLIDLIMHPIEFFKRIRWHDFFKWVR